MQTLIVLGAGPKAAAVAARSTALGLCDYDRPEVIVIEKSRNAAHWLGTFGYTDGRRVLCTPAERDVGFPYPDGLNDVSQQLLANFSWQSYLIAENKIGDWVSRDRPYPTHAEWAEYCDWVLRRTDASAIHAEITRIQLVNDRWRVTYVQNEERKTVDGDGVLLTGPGPAKLQPVSPPGDHACVVDGQSFWQETTLKSIRRMLERRLEPVGIIGSGGTAAAIAAMLIELFGESINITIFSRKTTLYTRGESYFERNFLTDPSDWPQLALKDREEFIKRIDRGAVSAQLMSVLNRARNIEHQQLVVKRIVVSEPGKQTQQPTVLGVGSYYSRGADRQKKLEFPLSLVIDASGFDDCWFSGLISGKVGAYLHKVEASMYESVDRDLSISFSKLNQLAPQLRDEFKELPSSVRNGRVKLFVPQLAGISQGPGFPNLGCLGTLAQRIIGV